MAGKSCVILAFGFVTVAFHHALCFRGLILMRYYTRSSSTSREGNEAQTWVYVVITGRMLGVFYLPFAVYSGFPFPLGVGFDVSDDACLFDFIVLLLRWIGSNWIRFRVRKLSLRRRLTLVHWPRRRSPSWRPKCRMPVRRKAYTASLNSVWVVLDVELNRRGTTLLLLLPLPLLMAFLHAFHSSCWRTPNIFSTKLHLTDEGTFGSQASEGAKSPRPAQSIIVVQVSFALPATC